MRRSAAVEHAVSGTVSRCACTLPSSPSAPHGRRLRIVGDRRRSEHWWPLAGRAGTASNQDRYGRRALGHDGLGTARRERRRIRDDLHGHDHNEHDLGTAWRKRRRARDDLHDLHEHDGEHGPHRAPSPGVGVSLPWWGSRASAPDDDDVDVRRGAHGRPSPRFGACGQDGGLGSRRRYAGMHFGRSGRPGRRHRPGSRWIGSDGEHHVAGRQDRGEEPQEPLDRLLLRAPRRTPACRLHPLGAEPLFGEREKDAPRRAPAAAVLGGHPAPGFDGVDIACDSARILRAECGHHEEVVPPDLGCPQGGVAERSHDLVDDRRRLSRGTSPRCFAHVQHAP